MCQKHYQMHFEVRLPQIPGATLVSLPQDVMTAETNVESIGALSKPQLGIAPTHDITYVVEKIKGAKLPVILLGMRASTNEVTKAVRELIADTELPVVEKNISSSWCDFT